MVVRGEVEVLQRILKDLKYLCREWWRKFSGIHKNIAEKRQWPTETSDLKSVAVTILMIVHGAAPRPSCIYSVRPWYGNKCKYLHKRDNEWWYNRFYKHHDIKDIKKILKMIKELNEGDTDFNTSWSGQSPLRELQSGAEGKMLFYRMSKEQGKDKKYLTG